jgi:hypothetical protein
LSPKPEADSFPLATPCDGRVDHRSQRHEIFDTLA